MSEAIISLLITQNLVNSLAPAERTMGRNIGIPIV